MGKPRLALTVIVTLSALALAGCVPAGDPATSPTPAPTRTATATPTAPPSPSPSATAGGPVDGQGCESLVTAATWSNYESSGKQFMRPQDFFTKVRSETPAGVSSPWLFFQDNGGIVCTWGNGSEVTDVWGFVALSPEAVVPFREAMLASDPYTLTESDTLLFTAGGDNPFALVFVDQVGNTYLASSQALLDEVRATIG